MSSSPRWARRLAQAAVAPLVVEKTSCRVSSVYGVPALRSATPPHRSTTLRPPTYTLAAAPTSPCSSKLARNASATPSNPGSTEPPISVISSPSSTIRDRRRSACSRRCNIRRAAARDLPGREVLPVSTTKNRPTDVAAMVAPTGGVVVAGHAGDRPRRPPTRGRSTRACTPRRGRPGAARWRGDRRGVRTRAGSRPRGTTTTTATAMRASRRRAPTPGRRPEARRLALVERQREERAVARRRVATTTTSAASACTAMSPQSVWAMSPNRSSLDGVLVGRRRAR